uniref:Uncharacterized protein n=1 Tax=Romanomermis culicivorax TaxID=13658 RepID=A0A915K446_ROMCU
MFINRGGGNQQINPPHIEEQIPNQMVNRLGHDIYVLFNLLVGSKLKKKMYLKHEGVNDDNTCLVDDETGITDKCPIIWSEKQ